MKKLLLISALLLVASNGWADDEFPIEVTCLIGEGGIIQFHLTKELFEIQSKRPKLDPNSWFRIPKESAPAATILLFNQDFAGILKPTKMYEKAKPYIDKKLYLMGDYKYRLSINDHTIMFYYKSPLIGKMIYPMYNHSIANISRSTGKIRIDKGSDYVRELHGTCNKGLNLPVMQDSLF